ncbi:MAG: hpsN 2 [Rhodospirillales bacterium]|nr:hpsN 2 [Rhodospirillales bacterium]
MVRYLKRAEPQSRQSNRELVERVRAMLDDIEQHRDEAVRRYAAALDRWTKSAFRVSDNEIGAARRAMSTMFKDDFAFCKKQVTDFAKRQRESLYEFGPNRERTRSTPSAACRRSRLWRTDVWA